jgi:hypothetical protein
MPWFQKVWYNHDMTILLQPCVVNLVTFLLYHDCIRLPRQTLFVRTTLSLSLIMPSSLLQVVNSLFQTCSSNWEQAVRTQLVDSLWTDLQQLVCFYVCGTHAKISHLVANLSTSRQQVVFALLVPSCQHVWNKLLTTCNNLVDIIRLVARLFQHVWYSHDITILLQPCVVNLVTFLLYHDCIRLVRTTL